MTLVTVTDVARTREWNPNVGPWLRAMRGKRKQDVVVADLAERGVVIGRSWLSRAENGAQMSDELLAAFQDYYGSVPPPYEPPVADPAGDASLLGLAALIEAQTDALKAQTEAFNRLAKSIDRAADRVTGRVEGFGDALVKLTQILLPPAKDEDAVVDPSVRRRR